MLLQVAAGACLVTLAWTWMRTSLQCAVWATSLVVALLTLSSEYGGWMALDPRLIASALLVPVALHLALGATSLASTQTPRPSVSATLLSGLLTFVGLAMGLSLSWSQNPAKTQDAIFAVALIALGTVVAVRLPRSDAASALQSSVNIFALANFGMVLLDQGLAFEQERFRGFFDNANELAGFLCVAIGINLVYGKKPRATFIVCVGLLCLLVWTGSRGGLLAASVGIFVFLGSNRASWGVLRVLGTTFLVVATGTAVLYSSEIFAALQSGGARVARTNDSRGGFWGPAISDAWSSLPLGYGYSALPYNPFSAYLKFVGEIGVFALFALILLSVVTLKWVFRRRYRSLTLLIIGLAHGVVESWLFTAGSGVAILFWVSLVLIERIEDEGVVDGQSSVAAQNAIA